MLTEVNFNLLLLAKYNNMLTSIIQLYFSSYVSKNFQYRVYADGTKKMSLTVNYKTAGTKTMSVYVAVSFICLYQMATPKNPDLLLLLPLLFRLLALQFLVNLSFFKKS